MNQFATHPTSPFASSFEEQLDLVNERDEVIGSMSRAEVYRRKLENFRVVHGFIVNKAGKIWIPRRAAFKKIAPNALDYSVAGHVESGESYEASFRRETAEEAGLDLDTVPWRPLGKLTPADGARFFEMVYEIQSEESPVLSPRDFVRAEWYTPAELVALVEAGELAKMDLAFTVRRFYL